MTDADRIFHVTLMRGDGMYSEADINTDELEELKKCYGARVSIDGHNVTVHPWEGKEVKAFDWKRLVGFILLSLFFVGCFNAFIEYLSPMALIIILSVLIAAHVQRR